MKLHIAALIVFGLVVASVEAKRPGKGPGKGKGKMFGKMIGKCLEDNGSELECEEGKARPIFGQTCADLESNGLGEQTREKACQDAAAEDTWAKDLAWACVTGKRNKALAEPFTCQDLTLEGTCVEKTFGKNNDKTKIVPEVDSCKVA